MPDMTASIPHQLTRSEAKQRIQDQIALVRQRHGGVVTSLQETWTGDRLQFSANAAGQSLSGHLTVDDQMVHLTVHLPWFLSILAGSIRHRLEAEGRQLLGRMEQEKPPGGQ
jgi:putative polyhydroxyalkanoic acid system protein